MKQVLYRERYEPLELAGMGGQGEVWRARDHVHDRLVALKIRRAGDDERDALLREVRTLLSMRPHEGLPLVRDDFAVPDRYVMVMDWIAGTNLASCGRLAFEDVLGHLAKVAAALDHLHAHTPPILHGDVKPANVVVTPDGRTVLVDFGLAGAAPLGRYAGTPAYVAPEIAAGGDVTPAADVFSLAVTALVLLTGDTPEPGREPDWNAVPESMRARVRDVLERALSVDPRMRPSTAGDLVASLQPPSTPSNLPAALSSFVGRDAATAELDRLVRSTRLLTLTGPGGSGKTRLALRVAETALSAFPDGVWLAELAGVSDAELVGSRVAAALDVAAEPGKDTVETLVSFLTEGRQLLMLDNCEHVVDACAHLVEALLRACAGLTIVATSREPLRASGETVWTVPPLAIGEAGRLFVERAPLRIEIVPELVERVCARLDGIPLAVELAAAALHTTGLDELVRALDDALGLLTGGARTVPRQETLRATIDWSHDRLDDAEQILVRRLSVFAGGFTSDAAGEVCDAGPSLGRLVETSFVTSSGDRHRMLETVRQYAAEELETAGEGAAFRARHALWCAGLAKRAEDGLFGPSHREWLDRFELEHDNLQAALGHTLSEYPALAAKIASSTLLYWHSRGRWNEGRVWLDRAVQASAGLDPELHAAVLRGAAELARVQGDIETAREGMERALVLFRETGARLREAACMNGLALIAREARDYARACALYEESIAIKRELGGDPQSLAGSLANLGFVLAETGDHEAAIVALEEALSITREGGNRHGVAAVLCNLATCEALRGDPGPARTHFAEALAMVEELGDEPGRAVILNNLGLLELDNGDPATAAAWFSQAMEITQRIGQKGALAESLYGLGEIARLEGDLARARELHAEALGLRLEVGDPLRIAESHVCLAALDVADGDPVSAARRLGHASALHDSIASLVRTDHRDVLGTATAQAREALGAEAFEREWNSGRVGGGAAHPATA